jgi:tape measure domain-containing protein
MAYKSRLHIAVDSRGAERDMQRFENRLNEVDRAGSKASGSVDRVSVSAGKLRGVALAASGALVGLTGTMSIGRVVSYSDAWTNAANQIRQVTDSSQQLTEVQERLVSLAIDTRSNFESTANLYARLARSTVELGLSQEELIALTGTINKSFAVSGATAQEASNAITQLSQGLASGALRGEEFNSVADQAPDILRAVADYLGIAQGELREFAATGGITAEVVVGALQKASDEIDGRFGSSIASFGQKLENANTNLISWVGNSENVNAAVGALGDGIEGLSENIDLLVDAGVVVAGVYGGRVAGSIAAVTAKKLAATRQAILYQGALARMAGVSTTAAASQTALAGAARGAAGALSLVGGPLGAAVIAMGAIYYFREELGLTQQAIGLTEKELADLRKEMAEMDGVQISETLSQVENSLLQVGLKAAAAREELAQLRSENSGSGVLGFEGGRVGEEIRGMQAVAEYTDKMAELEQRRAAIVQESGSRSFKPLTEWLFEVADANEAVAATVTDSTKALRDAQQEADRFASTLQSLTDRLFPLEAAQRSYRDDQELLTLAWAKGEMGVMRYLEALNQLEKAQLSTQTAAGAYGSGGGFGSEIGSRGGVGAPTDPLASTNEQDYWGEWLASAENAFSDFDKLNADMASNFTRSFGQMFSDVLFQQSSFSDGFQSMMQGVARATVAAIGEMIAQWLAYQAVTAAVGFFGGGGGFLGGLLPFSSGGLVPAGSSGGYGGGDFTSQIAFSDGGYTGPGGKYDPAGIVHAGEFVVRKEMVERPGVLAMLEGLNRGYANGGYVGSSPAASDRLDNYRSGSMGEGSQPTLVIEKAGNHYSFQGKPDKQTIKLIEQAEERAYQRVLRDARRNLDIRQTLGV